MPTFFGADPGEPPVTGSRSALCVLASGSRGNCSALLTTHADGRRDVTLIDLGLSPRRTRHLLDSVGIRPDEINAAIITHFDSDHCHAGWARGRKGAFPLFVHERHLPRAERGGFLAHTAHRFGAEPFEVRPGIAALATMMAHDEWGVAAFRFTLPCGATLGYATDLGRATQTLAENLAGVDVLAVESNYCPYLQKTSQRPAWLKQRIMGGAGHLSNAQSADLVRAINPGRRLVLLHLSQECNRPEVALRAHDQGAYDITVSAQDEPTGWIEIRRGAVSTNGKPAVGLASPKQHALFR